MKSLENFINEQHNKLIPVKDIDSLMSEGEYAIYVEKYTMERDNEYFEWGLHGVSYYILEIGDNTIGEKYGQDKYDDSSLSGQDLDGEISQKSVAKVFDEFKKRTGINIDKAGNPYKGEFTYRSGYFETEFLKKFIKGKEVFDIR